MTMHSELAVVIPFFQRDKGILLRAVQSALKQRSVPPPLVVVVDDGSPVPASEELSSLDQSSRKVVHIVQQENAGPGAARNAALDFLGDTSRYVAFLDSDDEWSADHLVNALCTLRAGHDVYFADHTQVDQEIGAFSRGARIRPSQHPMLQGSTFLHTYQGDMLRQIVCGNIIGTSTVVFDRSQFPSVRFQTEFRNAGEDYLFWMDLAQGHARFAFSERIEATYGRGVNIYSSAVWGTNAHLLRLINELKYRKRALQVYDLSPEAIAGITTVVHTLRKTIVRDLIHRLRRATFPPSQWVKDLIGTDPALAFLLVPLVVEILIKGRQ